VFELPALVLSSILGLIIVVYTLPLLASSLPQQSLPSRAASAFYWTQSSPVAIEHRAEL